MAEINLVLAVCILAAGTYTIRLGGVYFGESPLARQLEEWSEPAVMVLLASVTATSIFYDGAAFSGWARVAGVAVAAITACLRAPLVVTVLAAAGVTASLRLLGIQ